MPKINVHQEMPADAAPLPVAESIPVGKSKVSLAGYTPWPNEIEFSLPDGREVVMKPPRNISRIMAECLAETEVADEKLLAGYVNTVTAMLFVHSIDGEVVAKPRSPLQYDALEQRIGIQFISIISQKGAEYFPGFDSRQVNVVKK